MFDDLPIKPDQQYLQSQNEKQKEQQMIAHKKHFLHKSHSLVLPCQKENLKHQVECQKKCLQQNKKQSCAQKYEKIKKANKKKFGQWDSHKNKDANKAKVKKIDPKQMTINYKHKEFKIDTKEYKKQGYVPKVTKKIQKNQDKMEYKRMIDHMKKLYEDFEIQKKQFQQQKQYLKFKKSIKNLEKIKIFPENQKQNIKQIKQPKPHSNENAKSQFEIHDYTMNASQKQPNTIEQHQAKPPNLPKSKNPINTLYKCHPFNLKQISNFTNIQQLKSQNSEDYNNAKYIIENQRSTGLIQIIKNNCTHGSIGNNHATCSEQECQDKRITKFNDNWFEVWTPGRYRIMYNKEKGYKVVWYANGDIKQEFSGGRVRVYESKANKVVEITVDNHLPFWYFPYLQQLEMKNEKGHTQVIFMDGRQQTTVVEQ